MRETCEVTVRQGATEPSFDHCSRSLMCEMGRAAHRKQGTWRHATQFVAAQRRARNGPAQLEFVLPRERSCNTIVALPPGARRCM